MTSPETIERHALKIYGCSYADAIFLNDGLSLRTSGGKAMAYATQKTAAKSRGIQWEMTFPEWISVWEKSGEMNNRGVGTESFCMARHQDKGAYRVGNVCIKTNVENARESLSHTTWKMRFKTAVKAGKRIPREQRTTCIHGHPYLKENRTKHGNCKECERISAKKYFLRKKSILHLSS